MFYERKITYLDYLINQERCGNAGFLKLEVRDNNCNVTINVSGLRMEDSLPAKVFMLGNGEEKELCSLDLQQGRGMKQLLRQDAKDIGHTGISFENLEAFRITVSAGREIYGKIRENNLVSDKDLVKAEEPIATEKRLDDTENRENIVENGQIPMEKVLNIEENEPDTVWKESDTARKESDTARKESDTARKEPDAAEKEPDAAEEMSSEKKAEPPERKIPLYDNKWKQLWAIYPHITPFQDDREYLSLGPNDFVILPGKYFRMANNSFLLHGYYNYKHLVLKKMEHRGEERYYIGVPGNFYDREKQVAVMFGFESFESMEEPARMGDYGYYMMRVEL